MPVAFYSNGSFRYRSILKREDGVALQKSAQSSADSYGAVVEARWYDDDPSKPTDEILASAAPRALRFNMKGPAELQGAEAYLRGKAGLIGNPYGKGTKEHDDYERGWVQALKRSV